MWRPWERDVRHAGGGLRPRHNDGKALYHQAQSPGFSVLGQGRIAIIPVIFLIVIAVCAVLHYFFKHTRTGLRMYATGENPAAATLRGLNTKKCLRLSYLLSGADSWSYPGGSSMALGTIGASGYPPAEWIS
ncbi:MAG: ABC transporter permease subunit [[Clostridium] scindens]